MEVYDGREVRRMEALLLPVLLAGVEPVVHPAAWAVMTIDQESRGEPYAGKLAVAEVIRDRTLLKYHSDGSVEGTVLKPFQFSGWNTNDPNRLKAAKRAGRRIAGDPYLEEARRAWEEAVTLKTTTAQGALFYHADYIKQPAWAKQMRFVVKIGRHLFYADPKVKR
jgi:N-acetylmuramoyl-L-alanine amidase